MAAHSFFITILFFLSAILPAEAQRQGSYIVKETWDTLLSTFNKSDGIRYSMREGLFHYRSGKLINKYKIIPLKVKWVKVAPCQMPPCPEFSSEVLVYYVGVWQRFIFFDELPDRTWLQISKKTYEQANDLPALREGDWETLCWLRKNKKRR